MPGCWRRKVSWPMPERMKVVTAAERNRKKITPGLGYGLDLWKQAAPVIYTVAALLCVALTILVKKDDEP